MRRTKQIMSVVLTFALSVSGLAMTEPAAAKTQELTAKQAAITPQPTAEGLLELARANRLENIDMETYGDFQLISELRNTDSTDMLTLEAQNLEANADGVKMEYQLYDINQDGTPELFMLNAASGARAGVNIYRHNTDLLQVDHVKTIGGVSTMLKNPKKKQVVFLTSSSAFRMDIITFKMTKAGKLKKVVTYTQDGKKYKKNKKKISKKAFEKYFKSLDKLKKIKTGKIPDTEIPLTVEDGYTYFNKDVYYFNTKYDKNKDDTLVMTKANRSTAAAQDKFLAFRMTYSRLKNGEYDTVPELFRYVFGPDVKNPKTGRTFQEDDWYDCRQEVFGDRYNCPLLGYSEGEDGKKILTIEKDGLPEVTTEEGEAKNGAETYKTLDYKFKLGKVTEAFMSFFSEGPLTGRIAKASITFSDISGELPYSIFTYTYGVENTGYPEWDPAIDVQICGEGVAVGMEGAKNRTLTVESITPEYKQTIITNKNVSFTPYSGIGQFYTYREDGTTKWDIGNLITGTKEEFLEWDSILNPYNKKQDEYGEPKFEKGVFWDPK